MRSVGDSGSSADKTSQFLEKKVKLIEEKNEALKGFISQKESE